MKEKNEVIGVKKKQEKKTKNENIAGKLKVEQKFSDTSRILIKNFTLILGHIQVFAEFKTKSI